MADKPPANSTFADRATARRKVVLSDGASEHITEPEADADLVAESGPVKVPAKKAARKG